MSRPHTVRAAVLVAAVLAAVPASLLLAAALVGCGRSDEVSIPGRARPARDADTGAAAGGGRAAGGPGVRERTAGGDAVGAEPERPLVVFLGDSLTAGFGLGEEEAYPALVGAALAAEGRPVRVVNAGVSGDTSAGGLARLDWVLRLDPVVVVVELGPNDGLRGLPLAATEANLRRIVERIEAAGARVLLVGLLIPPNYGPDYAGRFAAIYPRLAAELDVPLVPFLLDGVGGEPDLNLVDGIHPNAAGHRRLAENVLPHLRPLLAAAPRAAAERP